MLHHDLICLSNHSYLDNTPDRSNELLVFVAAHRSGWSSCLAVRTGRLKRYGRRKSDRPAVKPGRSRQIGFGGWSYRGKSHGLVSKRVSGGYFSTTLIR